MRLVATDFHLYNRIEVDGLTQDLAAFDVDLAFVVHTRSQVAIA